MTSNLHRAPDFKHPLIFAFLSVMLALPLSASATPERNPARPMAPSATLAVMDQASGDARQVLGWIKEQADNAGKPYAVVDKKNARLFVFAADGRMLGTTPILVGAGLGDKPPAGLATRALSSLLPHEQTTPSGRFVSEPGINLEGEDIVWVNYDARISIHRLREGLSYKNRAQRLASGYLDDKRASLGCIVVPPQFYDSVVGPALGKSYGVVYVLPDTKPVEHLLSALQHSAAAR